MLNSAEFEATLARYIRARIPFISIRSTERARVIESIRKVIESINTQAYIHTLSQGIREMSTNRSASEDHSLGMALDFASQQMGQRQNLNFILSNCPALEDETEISNIVRDLVVLAAEKWGCIIVITAKPIWGQLQRLGMALSLSFPNEDEIHALVKDQLSAYQDQVPVEWDGDDIRKAAAILTGVSQVEAENILATIAAGGAIRKEDLRELTQAKDSIFSDLTGIERVQLRPDEVNVGGLGGLRRWLDKERYLLTADLRNRGIRPPRGILLVGVPGCGKSLSAKAIAANWDLPLYRLDMASIQGQYLGQSEGRLKDALSTADHVAPCILWIDEIEKGLAGATGSNTDGGTSMRIVGQFLYWLQEARSRVFVVATANDVSQLPQELLRRGRFDELFFVDLPSAEERKEIINIYAKRGLKYTLSDPLLSKLVDLSNGFAGSDLEAAVREVVKEVCLREANSHEPVDVASIATDEFFCKCFENIVPFSKTSPERLDAIRAWGRERAVPASGIPIGSTTMSTGQKRTLLV